MMRNFQHSFRMSISPALAAAVIAFSGPAWADPVQVEATLETTDSIRQDFQDGSNHFILLVRREGTAEGEGAFAGADVVEYGYHDVDPPRRGDPQGYLEVTTPEGDVAYLNFDVQATFLGGGEKPQLMNRGVWELVSGNGKFADMRGLGTVVITPGEETKFTLNGELAPAP